MLLCRRWPDHAQGCIQLFEHIIQSTAFGYVDPLVSTVCMCLSELLQLYNGTTNDPPRHWSPLVQYALPSLRPGTHVESPFNLLVSVCLMCSLFRLPFARLLPAWSPCPPTPKGCLFHYAEVSPIIESLHSPPLHPSQDIRRYSSPSHCSSVSYHPTRLVAELSSQLIPPLPLEGLIVSTFVSSQAQVAFHIPSLQSRQSRKLPLNAKASSRKIKDGLFDPFPSYGHFGLCFRRPSPPGSRVWRPHLRGRTKVRVRLQLLQRRGCLDFHARVLLQTCPSESCH